MARLKLVPAKTDAPVDPAVRLRLCRQWLAIACQHLRARLVMATQVRQARAAGLNEDEAVLSVEPTQVEVQARADELQDVVKDAAARGVQLPIDQLAQ